VRMNPPPHTADGDTDDVGFAFIVGAPRCGTTFLARHLRKHPDVCFSKLKEPHFFSGTDLRNIPDTELRQTVRRNYLDRFFPHRAGRAFLAEGSVTYLYTPRQLEPILRLWPDAKFIVALRNPMQMVPSLHQRLRYIGDETVSDFERAWALVGDRRQGHFVPRRCIEPRWLDYWESGKLGRHVEEFFNCVGRERCFISLFDDLVVDPGAQFRRVLQFLGLPDDHQSDFAPERQSRGFKIRWLQRLLKRPPAAALSLLGSEAHKFRFSTQPSDHDAAFAKSILALRKRLVEWNEAPAPPVRLSLAVQDQMRRMFGDDIRLLERVISRDLGHWLRTSAPVGELR
jgi:hypothetical protein